MTDIPAGMVAEGIMCGGCGATADSQRCIGCLHDFGTPDSAWVKKYHTPRPPLTAADPSASKPIGLDCSSSTADAEGRAREVLERVAAEHGWTREIEHNADFWRITHAAMRQYADEEVAGEGERITRALPGIDAMIANIDRWRETGQAATADESKALYEGLVAARAALGGEG